MGLRYRHGIYVTLFDCASLCIDTSCELCIFCGKYADYRYEVSVEFLLREVLVFERVVTLVIHCESFGSLTPISLRDVALSHDASAHMSEIEKVMSTPTTMNSVIVFLSRTG